MTEGGVCVTGCPIKVYEGSNARVGVCGIGRRESYSEVWMTDIDAYSSAERGKFG
jgi:hypothetical protein